MECVPAECLVGLMDPLDEKLELWKGNAKVYVEVNWMVEKTVDHLDLHLVAMKDGRLVSLLVVSMADMSVAKKVY